MADESPPPDAAISDRKRKISSRFDLPAAFGPTMNRRSPTSNSTLLKLRQLLASRCVILIDGTCSPARPLTGRII
jgi:hypothetical protein